MIHPQVYLPEADSVLLLESALSECRQGERVLEIGTGSGFIAAALSERASVLATDINPYAVRAARERGIEVVRTDLCRGIAGSFDLIIFNPPYLPTLPCDRIDDWLEYALDGGPDGRGAISRFADVCGDVLAPEGRILLLISSLTGLPEVCSIFRARGFDIRIFSRREVEGEQLSVLRISFHRVDY